jgi:hypothetical protein
MGGVCIPSFRSGFYSTRRGGRPKYPQLWRGCIAALCPFLGPTGSRLLDQSLYGNHCTLSNMDAATDWVVNQGVINLDFDGSNDLVSRSVSLVPSSSYSLVVWCRRTGSGGGGAGRIMELGTTNILLYGSASLLEFNVNGVGISSASSGLVTNDNRFYCAAATFSSVSGSMQLYENGRLLASGSSTSPASIASINIGNRADAARAWSGGIADARLYNRAISQSEIRLLASRIGIAYELDRSSRYKAASAPAFKAYWARRNSQLIGGGV